MRVILESLLFWWTVPLTGHSGKFYSLQSVRHSCSFCVWVDAHKQGRFGGGLVVECWPTLGSAWILILCCLYCSCYSDSSTCLSMLSSHDNWSSLQMSSHSSVLPMSHSSPPNSNSRWDHTLPLQFYCNKMYIYIFIYIHIYIYIFFIIYFFYEVINNPPHKFPCFFLEVLNIW